MGNGYAATTVPQIARAARVAVPTVYARTGGKAEILATLLEPLTNDPAADETLSAVAVCEDPVEVVRLTGEGARLTHERHSNLAVGLYPQSQAESSAARLRAEIMRAYQDARAVPANRLADLGALRPGLTRDDALDMLWFYLSHGAWNALVVDRGWTLRRAQDRLTAAALAALLREDGRNGPKVRSGPPGGITAP
ncbi:hypothetical protein A6A27_31740 [Micromonospora sp. CB01531]|nr:hypothetical protein A6A27_31740 [Micromonospora sp. CB01531]